MGSKSTQKAGPSSGGDSNSMSTIMETINAAFDISTESVTALPPTLIMAATFSGLSAKRITSRIISRQSLAGAPMGDIWGDGVNVMEGLISIICDEVVFAIQNEAKVDVVVPPKISLTATGAGNFGAPVVSQGYTTEYKECNGVIR